MENKKKKAHNFSFKKEGENLFDDEDKKVLKKKGRPRKNKNDKFTKQYTIQLKESDEKKLRATFNKDFTNIGSFAGYLRYLVLKDI